MCNYNFLVGGRYFFGKLNGFPKKSDHDFCQFTNKKTYFNFYVQKKDKGNDSFVWYVPNLMAYDYDNNPIALGKFLIPEILEYLKINFADVISIFENSIYKVKERHKYQIYIFECYKKNGDTYLTNEQLQMAFKIYKDVRSDNEFNKR